MQPLNQHHYSFLSFIGKLAGLAILADAAYNLQDKAGSPSVLFDPAAFNAILSAGMAVITAQTSPVPPAV